MPPKPIPPETLALRRQNSLTLFTRWRLQEIAQGRPGGDKAFSAMLGISNAQWSRIKSGTPVGPKLARQIEAACGVEPGGLDAPQDAATGPATEAPQHIDLTAALGLSRPDTFVIRMHGPAMAGKGLDDGDLLVVDPSIVPRHGHTVVARMDHEPCCRTLYQRDGQTRLQAAHPDFADTATEDGSTPALYGVVTAVVKRLAV
jgi:DNA polymerase V